MIRKIGFALGTLFVCFGIVGPGASAAGPVAPVPATFESLDGRSFVSTAIKGNRKKPKKITMDFTEGQAFWKEDPEEMKEIRPILGINAGCNAMGAGYRVKNGRVKWTTSILGTSMACFPDRSGWIVKRLRLGMRANWMGQTLVLSRGTAARVKLKPVK